MRQLPERRPWRGCYGGEKDVAADAFTYAPNAAGTPPRYRRGIVVSDIAPSWLLNNRPPSARSEEAVAARLSDSYRARGVRLMAIFVYIV